MQAGEMRFMFPQDSLPADTGRDAVWMLYCVINPQRQPAPANVSLQ